MLHIFEQTKNDLNEMMDAAFTLTSNMKKSLKYPCGCIRPESCSLCRTEEEDEEYQRAKKDEMYEGRDYNEDREENLFDWEID